MKWVLPKKTCVTCEKIFQPNNPRRIYCSDKCRRGKGVCEVCGVSFLLKGNTTGKYCSAACWYRAYDAQNEKQCPVCGKAFSGHSMQKTCSYTCGNTLKRTAKRNTNCAQCGKELRKNCHPRARFCSRRCGLMERDRRGQLHAKEGTRAPGGSGYFVVKVGKRWVLEHRHIMEKKLGRSLEPHERVHHKNGNRADNRPQNLELWKVKKKDPAGVRAADYHCPGCRCFE